MEREYQRICRTAFGLLSLLTLLSAGFLSGCSFTQAEPDIITPPMAQAALPPEPVSADAPDNSIRRHFSSLERLHIVHAVIHVPGD